MANKEEIIQELAASLQEQYRWFSGLPMSTRIATKTATRLYELGWRKEQQ